MRSGRLLVVDDEPGVRFALERFLSAHGFEVALAASFEEALESLKSAPPDLAVVDNQLGPVSAVEELQRLRAVDADVPLIVLTGHGSIDLAVRAIKNGAEHFFTKPVELPALLLAIRRTIENRRYRREHFAAAARAREAEDPFIGSSAAMRRLAEQARRVAGSDSPVLIQGETGSGKGVLARWLHGHGPRAEEPLVDLNCAGLSRDLMESELFGHQRGAFTGATADKAGLLELANRGTVLLDEIGDIEPAVQPKLLKALEEKRFRRLGDVRDRHVDVRLVAATHRDLPQLVAEGRFRADLYFRIAAIPLVLPPLRERTEDLPALSARLLERLPRAHCEPLSLSPAAVDALRRYSWPGNIRELRNVLERAALLASGPVLGPDDLFFQPAAAAIPAPDLALTLAEVERRHVAQVLAACNGKVDAAARSLGVPRSSLYQKLKQHGLASPRSGKAV
ncbi:MAG TPA: sigma-54 dependent transcriptional regulator [Anaeromyxobacteraceae bacterium]|nr:sigma-54 dependent transcriptional regulator [Anaeromyxobacteraceae bacterium]